MILRHFEDSFDVYHGGGIAMGIPFHAGNMRKPTWIGGMQLASVI